MEGDAADLVTATVLERRIISRAQFCELLGIDEARFVTIEPHTWTARQNGEQHITGDLTIFLEPEEPCKPAEPFPS